MSKTLTYADLVTACYRSMLGREPESQMAVDARAEQITTPEEMITTFLQSDEFSANRDRNLAHDYLLKNHLHDRLDIDVDIPDAMLKQMFDRIRGEWAALGETEPYWSVITSDEFRSENIQQHLDAFLKSGQTNINWMLNIARRNGVTLGKGQTCFELGCGVGRLTLPLAEIFDHVTGYDISPGNLAECEALIGARGATNITVNLMEQIEAIRDLPDFDVLFTLIVLQHNPPPVQKYILSHLLQKVRAGGAAYFQLPTYIPDYSFSAKNYLENDAQVMEMHAVPMHEVLSLLRINGFEVLEVIQDQYTGMPGSHSFFARKSS